MVFPALVPAIHFQDHGEDGVGPTRPFVHQRRARRAMLQTLLCAITAYGGFLEKGLPENIVEAERQNAVLFGFGMVFSIIALSITSNNIDDNKSKTN